MVGALALMLVFTVPAPAANTITILTPANGSYLVASVPLAFVFSPNQIEQPKCSIDFEPLNDCTSPWYPAAFPADGPHSYQVYSEFSIGNPIQHIAYSSVTVDTIEPSLSIIAPAPGAAIDTSEPDIAFTVEGGSVECRFDDQDYVPCETGAGFGAGPLPKGSHVFWVRATDRAGNVTEQSSAFTINDPKNFFSTPSEATFAASGGKPKHRKFLAKLTIKIVLPVGIAPFNACVGEAIASLKAQPKLAKEYIKKAPLKVSGANCLVRAKIKLPSNYKGKRLVAKVTFRGNAAIGRFNISATLKKKI